MVKLAAGGGAKVVCRPADLVTGCESLLDKQLVADGGAQAGWTLRNFSTACVRERT